MPPLSKGGGSRKRWRDCKRDDKSKSFITYVPFPPKNTKCKNHAHVCGFGVFIKEKIMKKLLLVLSLMLVLTCMLTIFVSAETPTLYITFQVKLAGDTDYTTAYVVNPEEGNPRVNLTLDFYSDIEFTQLIDKSQITVLDFSGAVHSNPKKDYVDRFTTADPSLFPLCEEVKWFSRVFTSAPSKIFNDWTQLKRFDFGCITFVDYNFLSNTGLEEVVVPAEVTTFKNGVFSGCNSLKSVIFEGGLTSIGTGVFQNCTALERVDLGSTTVTNTSMFAGCTSLTSITLSPVTKLSSEIFKGCTALTTVDLSLATELKEINSSAFSGCTSLTTVKLPAAITSLTTIGNFAFSGCSALKTISSSGIEQEGAVIIPEGVTSIGQEAFYNCDSIKYLSLPSTITYLGPSIIRDSSGLEFVDFNENANAINLDNWGHFKSCSNLKAVSLPDGIKTINNRFMTYCTNLQAVYLPANLVQMNTNNNGEGPFCFSKQMYLVQEPFEVRDENGYFLGDSFVMPEKPEIYFMPENLSRAGGNVHIGTWFRDCAGLNNTIVMPEAFTESTVVQMFRGIASSTQRKTVVYLGKMTNYAWSEMNRYIDFVFANPANTDLSTINFTSFYNKNNENCYFYFCKTGYKYTMAKSSVEEIANTLETNSYCHIVKETRTQDATCELPKMTADFCFCGAYIPGTETPEGDALGHNYTGAVTCYFTSVIESGKKCTVCVNGCGIDEEVVLAPVYTSLGVSVNEFAKTPYSFSSGYDVDLTSKALYEETMGVKIKLGFAFNSADDFTSSEVTLDSFALKTTNATETVNYKFSRHDFVMSYTTDEHLAKDIIIAAYVVATNEDGESVIFINRSNDTSVGVNGFEATSYQRELAKSK